MTYEPLDDVQERIFTGFPGGSFPVPPRRFVPDSQGPLRAGRDAAPGIQRILARNFSSHTTVSAMAVRTIDVPVVA